MGEQVEQCVLVGSSTSVAAVLCLHSLLAIGTVDRTDLDS